MQEIGLAIIRAQTAHADESGMRGANKLHWLHVLATDTLTWMALHPKRGFEAFESLAVVVKLFVAKRDQLKGSFWGLVRAPVCLG